MIGWLIVLAVIALVIGLAEREARKPLVVTKDMCKKDASKPCPKSVTFCARGGMTANNIHKCCAYWDQLKAADRLMRNAKKGVYYNGSGGSIRISDELIDYANSPKGLRESEWLQSIDTSGGEVKIRRE